jgi:hypothetical protein
MNEAWKNSLWWVKRSPPLSQPSLSHRTPPNRERERATCY